MSETPTIAAQMREHVGKGSARAARRAGLVPAVVYGGERGPASITVSLHELDILRHAGGFTSSLFELVADGKKQQVLPREVQLDPVTDRPIHVDFLRVEKDSTVTIMVPVMWIDQEESPGLTRGGVINVVRHEIELLCQATAIPTAIEVSVAGLDIGDGIHISGIELPEGSELTIKDRDFTVVTIAAPSALVSEREEEEEGEEEEFEEGEVAEGEDAEGAAEGKPEGRSE